MKMATSSVLSSEQLASSSSSTSIHTRSFIQFLVIILSSFLFMYCLVESIVSLLYRHLGKILSIISNLSLLVLPITTGHQLSITDKVIAILKPVEDINHSVSSGRASASMLISFVRTQRGSWESNDDHGIQTMKMKMLYFLNDRYCDVESNERLVCATLLNPCIKDRFFSCSTVHLYAKTVGD